MNKEINDELLNLEKLLFKKSFYTIDNLEKILSNNFFEYGKSGIIISRKETIDFLSQSEDRNIMIDNFTSEKISENIYIIHYISTSENNIKALRTSIWIKNNNEYQLYFHQGTPINNQ